MLLSSFVIFAEDEKMNEKMLYDFCHLEYSYLLSIGENKYASDNPKNYLYSLRKREDTGK